MAQEVKAPSTWRTQRNVTIPAKTPTDVTFDDTHPNYVLITNNGSGVIYAAGNALANLTNYDISIQPKNSGLIPRDVGMTRVSIYSDAQTSVTVNSFEGDFSPSAVAQAVMTANGQQGGGGGSGGGVASNVTINTGTNHIGSVTVDGDTPVHLTSPLPAGTNVIGHTVVDQIPPLPAGTNMIGHTIVDSGSVSLSAPIPTGNNLIGQVTVANPSMSSIASTGVSGAAQVPISATTATQLVINNGTRNFSLKNLDSTNTLYIGFDNTVSVTNGYPIDAKQSLAFDVDASATGVSLWVYAPTALTVATLSIK